MIVEPLVRQYIDFPWDFVQQILFERLFNKVGGFVLNRRA